MGSPYNIIQLTACNERYVISLRKYHHGDSLKTWLWLLLHGYIPRRLGKGRIAFDFLSLALVIEDYGS